MTPQQIYQWLVELIAQWPETKVTMTWGEPHFRVGDKIFSGWGAHKDGRYSMGIKLDKDKQAALVASDPRFAIAPYVGKHGWVSFHPGDEPDLGEVEALLMESYRNVASKAQVARLESGDRVARAPAKRPAAPNAAPAKQATAKQASAQKPAARQAAQAKAPAAKATAKQAAQAKAPAAKATAKKPTAKQAAQAKAPAAKATAKKAPAKKPAAKKPAAKKAAQAKAPAARAAKPKAKAKRR